MWKLRTPITPVESTFDEPKVDAEVQTSLKAEAKPESKIEILPVENEASSYCCTISDDKKWAFIWPASQILSASQGTLFSNILVALKITKSTQTQLQSLEYVTATVMIVMGEAAAQQVLNMVEPIETLRGKMHNVNNMAAVVTYHPCDMLQNLQLKSKTWEDLCFAKRIVAA